MDTSKGPVFVKRRTKGRGGLAASTSSTGGAAASPGPTSTTSAARAGMGRSDRGGGSHDNVDDDNDDDDGIAIVRTAGLRGRRAKPATTGSGNASVHARSRAGRDSPKAPLGPLPASALSFDGGTAASTEGDEPVIDIRKKRSGATMPGSHPHASSSNLQKAAAVAAGAHHQHRRLDDLDLGRSSHAEELVSSPYSPAALAELKAATPNRDRNGGVEMQVREGDKAYSTIADPSQQRDEAGDSLTRMKFGADFAHDAIPSDAVIAAAKEKRRRGIAGESGAGSTSEDFISLYDPRGSRQRDQDPHPESRLQREEDDVGSGEDEFADFTGATERVALGHTARDAAKREETRRRREAMDIDQDDDAASDDSEREWETAQLQRMQISNGSERKRREAREPSPFRAAPIPRTAPLPQLSAASARLQKKLEELEAYTQAHDAVAEDASRQIIKLQQDEQRNKSETEAAAAKEAWFREFDDYIISMARFMEEKVPRLQGIEREWTRLLVERCRIVRSARANMLADDIALFHGVPATSLLSQVHTDEDSALAPSLTQLPSQDGDALSNVRGQRRGFNESLGNAAATNVAKHAASDLAPADHVAFETEREQIVARVRKLLEDVQAPEFLEPAARISREDGTKALHPSSLVARFHRWRRLYQDEYSNAWGGLTLASVWDFWIRRELCGWDMLRLDEQQPSARSLDEFGWYAELAHYAERSKQLESAERGAMDEDEPKAPLGGDDEVVAHAFSNTVLPLFTGQLEAGVFDAWSAKDNRNALELAEQISYVLEKDNWRYQVSAHALWQDIRKS